MRRVENGRKWLLRISAFVFASSCLPVPRVSAYRIIYKRDCTNHPPDCFARAFFPSLRPRPLSAWQRAARRGRSPFSRRRPCRSDARRHRFAERQKVFHLFFLHYIYRVFLFFFLRRRKYVVYYSLWKLWKCFWRKTCIFCYPHFVRTYARRYPQVSAGGFGMEERSLLGFVSVFSTPCG